MLRRYRERWPFDFFVPVSGRDYGLVGAAELARQMATARGFSWFGKWFRSDGLNRHLWIHQTPAGTDCGNRSCSWIKRVPLNQHVYKGSPNFYLARRHVDELVEDHAAVAEWSAFFSKVRANFLRMPCSVSRQM